MTDFKLLFRITTSPFTKATIVESNSSPSHSMMNMTIQQNRKNFRSKSAKFRKKYSIGSDFINFLYLKHLDEAVKLHNLYRISLNKLSTLNSKMNEKAKIIQKIARGYLTRKLHEEQIIQIARSYALNIIDDLCKFSEEAYYKGIRLNKAVIKVQSAAKTWIFLKNNKTQIETIKYNLVQSKKSLQVISCRFRLKLLRKIKIKNRLRVIRKKLALITISNFFRNKKKASQKIKKLRRNAIHEHQGLSLIPGIGQKIIGTDHYSESEVSSSNESLEASKFFAVNSKGQRPSIMNGIPVLVEMKRKSQIWVERFDEKMKVTVIDLKKNDLMQGARKFSATRPGSVLLGRGSPLPRHRNSMSLWGIVK